MDTTKREVIESGESKLALNPWTSVYAHVRISHLVGTDMVMRAEERGDAVVFTSRRGLGYRHLPPPIRIFDYRVDTYHTWMKMERDNGYEARDNLLKVVNRPALVMVVADGPRGIVIRLEEPEPGAFFPQWLFNLEVYIETMNYQSCYNVLTEAPFAREFPLATHSRFSDSLRVTFTSARQIEVVEMDDLGFAPNYDDTVVMKLTLAGESYYERG